MALPVHSFSLYEEASSSTGWNRWDKIKSKVSNESYWSTWIPSRILRIVFFLPLLSLIFSIPLQIYFNGFSTFYCYFSFWFLVLPTALFSNQRSLAFVTSFLNRAKTLVLLSIFLNLVSLYFYDFSLAPKDLSLPQAATSSSSNLNNSTYFIASNLKNSEHIFPAFSKNLLNVIEYLGPENVFVSIYESNSNDYTRAYLSELDQKLEAKGVGRKIAMVDDDHPVRQSRVKYLANVRNRALTPIDQGLTGLGGRSFKNIIWLNDVFFRPSSVIELLNTNNGVFDQACAFDYTSNGIYDSWVTRDRWGIPPKLLWPYFKNVRDISALRKGEPISVNSCWNGISVFDFKLFEPKEELEEGLQDESENILPLRFRILPECTVSECLLSSYDIHRVKSPRAPLIFMNPKAVATYIYSDYLLHDYLMRTWFSRPWKVFWQDFVSNGLFSWLTDIGRDSERCSEYLTEWARPPQT